MVVGKGSLVMLLLVLVESGAVLVKVWTDGAAVYVRCSVVVLKASVEVLE